MTFVEKNSEGPRISMMDCRVLPLEASLGPENMALDEVLLESVAASPSTAALRTYLWSEPTLSLGYFQPFAAVNVDPRWRETSVVRRPTGGGALWHHHEVTYALVIPKTHHLARLGRDLYIGVHDAIAEMLRSEGIVASRRDEDREGLTEVEKPFLCFADRDPDDVVSGGAKIVGSAQRRRAGAILQHGSLLLSSSPVTPELPGLAELGSALVDPGEWSERLVRAVTTALGLRPVRGEFLPRERARANELADSVYRNSAWTRKR
jgi:lipoate-protein ligase A